MSDHCENVPRLLGNPTAAEVAWEALAAALTAWSLLAVGLAQAGLLHNRALLTVELLAH